MNCISLNHFSDNQTLRTLRQRARGSRKKSFIIGLGISLLIGAQPDRLCLAQAGEVPPAASTASSKSQPGASGGGARFDDLVRDDFFSDDDAAFDRGMKLCEQTLAEHPKHAEAMVWHGGGLLRVAGKSFQAGDVPKGVELWGRGLKEMQDAVSLQPTNLAVLIPQGATLLSSAKYVPDPGQARAMIRTGVADYEKILQIQQPYFAALSTHSRGELLFGLADGWLRLGDLDKSRAYLRRITKDCAGSVYATRANSWLEINDVKVLREKSKAMSCTGCHERS